MWCPTMNQSKMLLRKVTVHPSVFFNFSTCLQYSKLDQRVLEHFSANLWWHWDCFPPHVSPSSSTSQAFFFRREIFSIGDSLRFKVESGFAAYPPGKLTYPTKREVGKIINSKVIFDGDMLVSLGRYLIQSPVSFLIRWCSWNGFFYC